MNTKVASNRDIASNSEKFFAKAKTLHNNKYDYSKTDYRGSTSRVIIICPVHGEFEQIAGSHLRYGCFKCGVENSKRNRTFTKEEFVAKAKEVHGDKYDYTDTVYVNFSQKVSITCPVHGAFLQSSVEHLRGRGCAKCGGNHSHSTEEYIERAKEVHGANKYGYSKTEYKGTNTRITITCPTHGDFSQEAGTHLEGHGCPVCGRLLAIAKTTGDTVDFLKRAKEIHGDTYDYSQVVYVHSMQKVTIGCKKHGNFEQTPVAHLQGYGCYACGKEKQAIAMTNTTEEFIEKAKKVHGADTYDYSDIIYTGFSDKINIICPTHGVFEQTPAGHLNGYGCRFCSYDSFGLANRLTQKEFITKAQEVHGVGTYDYSDVIYTTSGEKVDIICPVHGRFEQAAASHLDGRGCILCGYDSSRLALSYTQKEFVAKAQDVHGKDRYNYDNSKYVNSATPVRIGCKVHGEFSQRPSDHFRGVGCFRCSESAGERAIAKILDAYSIKYIREYRQPDNLRYRYDFYLPDHNLFIEFHGKQHYEYIPYFHRGVNDLATAQLRDDVKRQIVRAYGGTLFVLNYQHLEQGTLSETLIIKLRRLKII